MFTNVYFTYLLPARPPVTEGNFTVILSPFPDYPIKSGNDRQQASNLIFTYLPTHHLRDCFVAIAPRNDSVKGSPPLSC